MKLVTRYVVREHVGPLLFALCALTSLLMLQYVARQLANLAGKGLPWMAIGQFFVLSLPFTVAMTLPMAVLVATLYAFGRMAAEHEITAFKASGVRVSALMAPVLVCALFLSLAMVAFNDQVLPRANHQLRILQQDIARTKPTLALRDQVLNAVTDQIYMKVARTDAATNRMWDVILYDLTKGPERKTVYADSGLFLVAPNGKDLQLQLFSGHSQEFVKGDPRRLQRSYFQQQLVQLRGIAQGFEASRSDTYKGDREMSVCEMERKYLVSATEFKRARDEYIMYTSRLAPKGTTVVRAPRERPPAEALARLYCVTLPALFRVKSAHAQGSVGSEALMPLALPQPPVQQPPVQQPPVQQPPVQQSQGQPSATAQPPQQSAPQAQVPPSTGTVAPPAVVPEQGPGAATTPSTGVPLADSTQPALPISQAAVESARLDSTEENRAGLLTATMQMNESRDAVDSLAVEIHKKFALSFACLVFVLFGPPIALRFPRGGVGVTLGVSIVVFGLYYICLMAGEALADKGRLPAFVAMWIANVTFTIVGIAMLWRVESTTDGSRGGSLLDRWRDRKIRRAQAAARSVAQPAVADNQAVA